MILIAPDSFKASLSAAEVCDAVEAGIRRVTPDAEIVKVPMADGGEGTVQALVDATGGELVTEQVTGPLGEMVSATFGLLGDTETAVIEMAAASGLPLVPSDKRNPLVTTTYGTGQLILAALEWGRQRLIVGVGGSATNDGGAGMAQALGAKLPDADGAEIAQGGGELAKLHSIDASAMTPLLTDARVQVACDVTNPLCGPEGASHVYGPQKGATPEMVQQLDANLAHYADVVRRDLGKDVAQIPGAGAAGGLGAGLVAFCDAELKPGIELVIDAVQLEQKMRGASLVITGEGKIDAQSASGKTPMGVAELAKSLRVPVAAIGGAIGEGAELLHEHGVGLIMPIVDRPMSLEEAMRADVAKILVANTAERVVRAIGLCC
jgi:glycerate kinase